VIALGLVNRRIGINTNRLCRRISDDEIVLRVTTERVAMIERKGCGIGPMSTKKKTLGRMRRYEPRTWM
jgi:hypothetical protein